MNEIELFLGDAKFKTWFDIQNLKQTKTWKDTTHFHVNNEVHFIKKGSAILEINGEIVTLNEGAICLIAPNASHFPKKHDSNLERICFSFGLYKNNKYKKFDKKFSEYSFYNNVYKLVKNYFVIYDEELTSIINKIITKDFKEENQHELQAYFSLFYIILAKKIKDEIKLNLNIEDKNEFEKESSSWQKKKVEEFFQTRYAENVTILDLADELCISTSQTYRVVKKIFSGGFKKTLTKQRIEHACMLIRQNKTALIDVAYSCGYNSYNGFFFAFKNFVGKTPEEYKSYVLNEKNDKNV